MKKTKILEVVSRKLAPFVLLFGFYVIIFGHLSPGGGFQGGVVLASAVVLLLLCQNAETVQSLFPMQRFMLMEIAGFSAFLLIGMVGLLLEGNFLGIFLPVVTGDEDPHASFVLILNLIIGFKVGAGISLVCFHLFRES